MKIVTQLLVLLSFVLPVMATAQEIDDTVARQKLIDEIREDVRRTRHYIDKMELATEVMEVLGKVKRHEFVPEKQRPYAYENRPLPIGFGQTISQPFIVALMTDLLQVEATDRVLEIGTGSGYQAAVLAHLTAEVYTIEIVEPLGSAASHRLQRLGYDNVKTRVGDGYYGWPEAAPFDAIIVTAAAGQVPPPLMEQLKVGGRMVIPVGSGFQTQQLLLITKENEEQAVTRQILPVVFVPLTGDH